MSKSKKNAIAVVEAIAPVVEPVVAEPVVEAAAIAPVVEPVVAEPVVEAAAIAPVVEPVVAEPVVEAAAIAPVVEPVVAEPVAAEPALRTLATTGTVAEIWAYLADPANADKASRDMRKELVAKGYKPNTVSAQMFSFKRGNGNRHIGNAFLRNKEHGAATAAKLAQ